MVEVFCHTNANLAQLNIDYSIEKKYCIKLNLFSGFSATIELERNGLFFDGLTLALTLWT